MWRCIDVHRTGGGTITVGAEECGHDIKLTFSDQGHGIKPDDIAKIFQPYFTTKDVGIGLGLAITERIIKEHGGSISVDSQPGEGTTFTVILPQKQTEEQDSRLLPLSG